MHARVLKFHVWNSHEKIADTYFLPRQDYAPFLSYGPLKNMDGILSAKYLKKTIEARALKLKE